MCNTLPVHISGIAVSLCETVSVLIMNPIIVLDLGDSLQAGTEQSGIPSDERAAPSAIPINLPPGKKPALVGQGLTAGAVRRKHSVLMSKRHLQGNPLPNAACGR